MQSHLQDSSILFVFCDVQNQRNNEKYFSTRHLPYYINDFA